MSDKAKLEALFGILKSALGMSDKEEVKTEDTVDKEVSTPILKAFNQEQMICTEIVYKPDERDAHGEWASAETIAKAEDSFQRAEVVANLFHVTPTSKFSLIKDSSKILSEDHIYQVGGEDKIVKAGTWIIDTQYNDEGLWEMKKAGTLGGLSLGGYGNRDANTGELTNLCFDKEHYKEMIAND